MSGSESQRARFGPFEVDLHTHELWKFGTRLKLVGQPFEILSLMLSKPGELITREELHLLLWPADTFVDFNHGLNAAVNKLRETLSDSAENPQYIETLPRRGYRFIGKVEAVRPPEAAAVREPVAELPTPPAPVAGGEKAIRLRRLLAAFAGTAALLLVFLALVLGRHFWRSEGEGQTQGTASPLRILTLVPDPASDPAISPDGKAVAFRRNSYTPGGAGIFVTSSEGQTIAQLTEHPGDCCPAWSPDGKKIAFSRMSADEYGIYVVDARGGTPRKLSHEDPRKKR